MTFYLDAKILVHHERLRALLAGDTSVRPVTAHIGLTSACNHDCVWCGANSYRGKYSGTMGRDMLLRFLEEFATGGKSVVWTGSGEPTINKAFAEGAGRAAQYGLKQGLVTNGSRLDLVDPVQFSWVRVSLDAGTDDTYRRLHGLSSSDQFAGTVEKMAAFSRTSGRGVLGVSFVFSAANIAELPELVSLLDEIGVDYLRLQRLVPGSDGAVLFPAVELDLASLPFTSHLQVFRSPKSEGGNAGLPCWVSALHTFVAPSGDVFLCCRLANTGADEISWLGSLQDNSFAEIWSGERRAVVLQQFLSTEYTQRCPTCPLTPYNRFLAQVRDPVAFESLMFV